VIFPRTAVTIRQLGRDPAICDRNQIVFYNPGARFFRTLRTTAGDHCYFVELSPQLMHRLAGGMGSFPFVFGPCDASVFLLQRLGVDPATSSAPFVATLVDVTGLVIYFTVASIVLRGILL